MGSPIVEASSRANDKALVLAARPGRTVDGRSL